MFPIINKHQIMMRTFVFQKEDTQQSLFADQELNLYSEKVDLNPLFQRYCPLTENRVSIYDPSHARFSSLFKLGAESGLVPTYLLEPSVILIRFIKFSDIVSQSDSSFDSLDSRQQNIQRKDGRSKQRTIAEVIEVVKKWRELHLHGHKSIKKRLNLQDAAKLVGVPKKSLDDYYCQLRLGELYQFDFHERLDQKMGVLRTYVKNYRPSKEQTVRRQNDKHPKNLKIIKEYDLSTHSLPTRESTLEEEQVRDIPELPPFETNRDRMQEQPDINGPENFFEDQSPFHKDLFNLENDFFKGFEVPGGLQEDPYYDIDRDFRKKDYQFDSNNFFFFD